ncbi:hypothetical protein RRG08_058402 [Elysia crispata]|uniref:Uncharacterized protein n=1 Tax=Elysia crispata TaxID=231223 RepID=A0AAE1CNB0_9GAST|nr:hypothetical protein RRG08_058402 [Elysia crispata]
MLEVVRQLTIRRCSTPAMGCGAPDAGVLQLWAVELLMLEVVRQLTIRRCSTPTMGCGAPDAGGSAPADDPTLQYSSYGLWSS